MNNVYMLFLVIIAFVLIGWIFQAIRLMPDYKTGIYRELYGSFPGYFWRTAIRQDASESSYLKHQIGTCRILFSKMDENGKTVARFCTIFYNRGIFVICYESTDGIVHGKARDKDWIVTRTDKDGNKRSFRHPSPVPSFEAYLRRIAALYPLRHMEARIAFRDETDISGLKCDIKVIHNEDLISEMNNVKAEYLSDQDIKDDFARGTGKA